MAGAPRPENLHLLSVLVENKPGVLARVALLFSRRGFNIFSLAVAPTADPAESRITIVVDADSAPIEQITKQLDKLVNILAIEDLPPSEAVERELLLATVAVSPAERSEVLALADAFRGSVVDVSEDRLTVMVADHPRRLDTFSRLLGDYGDVELQRTGRVALPQLDRDAAGTAPVLKVAGE